MDQFIDAIFELPMYAEALKLTKLNSFGSIHLVGDAVSHTIAKELYGVPEQVKNFDFIVEERAKVITIPKDWVLSDDPELKERIKNLDKWMSKYLLEAESAYARFKHANGTQVQLISIDKVIALQAREEKSDISKYLEHAPLNIESITYDVNSNKIWGKIGHDAILDRKVRCNDWMSLCYVSYKKAIAPNNYLKEQAKRIGFATELINND